MTRVVTIKGLDNFPLVKQGDNLAELIVSYLRSHEAALDNGDIVVVAHKVVSKAEGRFVRLRDVKPSPKALELSKKTLKDPRLVEVILRETEKIVKATPEILIVQNRQGVVCINAGLDKSNVEGEDAYLLLPRDSDESARQIRSELKKKTGKNVSVLITDTYSRPFRQGQVEFTIGIAGIQPFRDYRGSKDLFGYALKVKNTAVADEIASAAELVMGQGDEGVPVAVIRGLGGIQTKENVASNELLISKDEDLFTGIF